MQSRRPDGAAIDQEKKIPNLLGFKRTTDQRADFEKKARVRAEWQYEDVMEKLTKVGRSMGVNGARMDSEATKIRRRHKWVVHKDSEHMEKNLEERHICRNTSNTYTHIKTVGRGGGSIQT